MGNKGSKANTPVLRKEDLDALVKTSGMTEQEVDKKGLNASSFIFFIQVKDYFAGFVNEHKDGKITKPDFGPMMAKV